SPTGIPQYNGKPKKKHGCLKGCLISVMAVVLIIVGIVLLWPDGPRNIELARGKTIEKTSVDQAGGIIDAGEIKIDIPEDAFAKKTSFKIKTREIKEHHFGDAFIPITPVFSIDNNDRRSTEPMTVTIPIDIEDDEFAMAFYYNKDGSLEPLPLIYQDSSQIVAATTHFSDIVASKISIEELMALDIDTGFRPEIDDWSFANYGSQISPGGHCAGQSVSMAYYYNELKAAGDPGLHAIFDNNTQQVKTPQFDRDDSLGIRLASVMQKEGDWDGYHFVFLREQIHRQKYVSDRQMYYAFAYSMHLTGEPQMMGIFVREANPEEEIKLSAGHAIVIYRIAQGTMYVADPNFPGNANLTIPLNGEVLGPYVSKTSANKPDRLYNSYSLIGKTAIFDYSKMAGLFSEMNKSTQESKIGNGLFGGTSYSIIVDIDKNGNYVLAKNPELVVFDEETKNKIKNKYETDPDAPADWDKQDYMIIVLSAGASNQGHVRLYSGTTELARKQTQSNTNMVLFVPIRGGVNDIGMAFYDRGTVVIDGDTYYDDNIIHFHRIKVENGEVDLTGNWEGTFQFIDAGGLMDYAQWVGEIIAKGMMQGLAPAFGVDMPSDEEISQAVRNSIEVNEEAFEPFPMTVNLSRIDKQNYDATITITTDVESIYETRAKYRDGKLYFTMVFEDGSAAEFTMNLYDNNVLAGEFEIKLTLFQSVTGESILYR
ncbi:MAG: hypothetical protein GX028_01710, partial [Clostridiaceae bacterium]|nr:hypothetical protein [Clostridiaceae bacterium]